MATEDVNPYMAYEARLASFKKNAKKRASTASVRGKALSWPHKQIAPLSLAKAGFYFNPTSAFPDNVTCFLCGKGFDGWEAGDDPLLEHLKHASHCGWAVMAAIEAEEGDYANRDPSSPEMIEAREATFAGMWPHEGKKGWKCKTKQLAESGWKYTPTAESDDMATCAYCCLAVDGWEPSDKPYDEHHKRAPDCAFFVLSRQFEGTRKKTSRAKAGRGSKASRTSMQSVVSEAMSGGDTTAVGDDSIVTTASTSTQGGRKTKPRKAATTKPSRTKAKKKDAAETQDEEPVAPPPKPAKATRGKKRGNEAVDDASMAPSEAPATKKRATRSRGSAVTDASTVIADDSDVGDATGLSRKTSGRKKNPAVSVISSRHVSAFSTVSTASMASLRVPADEFPGDDEIERQLEADLARESDEDVDMEAYYADTGAESHLGHAAPAEYAMFDPAGAEPDDAAVEEELLALQAEMQVDGPEPPQVPKGGRKPATRKASAQTKAKPAKASSPPLDEEAPAHEQPAEVVEEPRDAAVADTALSNAEPEVVDAAPKRGRGRPPKASLASRQSNDAQDPPPPAAKRGPGRPSKSSLASRMSANSVELVEAPAASAGADEHTVKRGRGRPPKSSLTSRASVQSVQPVQSPPRRKRGRPSKTSLASATETKHAHETEGSPQAPAPQPVTEAEQAQAEADDLAETTEAVEALQLEEPTSPLVVPDDDGAPPADADTQHLSAEAQPTPAKIISPAPSAKQAALSPSPSPQSSDAENHPPPSKSASSTSTKRVVLAPVEATPVRGSPSRRDVLARLESSTPWTAVNLEAVLGTPSEAGADKENVVGRMLHKGKELTSPEKGMTVEEWIYFNAGEAEKKLKHECESMVSRFEHEGTRAINVLEGLSVE